MSDLIISNRDPTESDQINYRFWLNYTSKELFEFYGKWISVSDEFVKIKYNQPDSSKREDVLNELLKFGEKFESMMRYSEHDSNAVKEVQ
jgi:hypothetical protein